MGLTLLQLKVALRFSKFVMENNGNNNLVVGPDGAIYRRINTDNNTNGVNVPVGNGNEAEQRARALGMGMNLWPPQQGGGPPLMNPVIGNNGTFYPGMARGMPPIPVQMLTPGFIPNPVIPGPGGNLPGGNIQGLMNSQINQNMQRGNLPVADVQDNSGGKTRRREDLDDGLAADPSKRMKLLPIQAPQPSSRRVCGRFFMLYIESDERSLSSYQCLARKQIELFESTPEEAGTNAQGRNKPINPGQVGIRCRHCSKLPKEQRKTGSVYYPNRVSLFGRILCMPKGFVRRFFRYC